MDVNTAKALLQRKEGGTSVYEHLTEVILKLITDQPANAVAIFEQLSAQVKGASYPAVGTSARSGGQAVDPVLAAARDSTLAAYSKLMTVPEGEGAPGEPVQNLTEESNFHEWAGVSLGRTETFRLHMALKHLAAKKPVKNLRFFGKLFGTDKDYLVVEGVMDAEEEEADDAKDALGNAIQKTGDGPNKYTYFVCNALGEEWIKLPRVTPHQVTVARKTRRLLTGRLDAAVGGHPPFPGTEREYLRARIALISAVTAIAPTGLFQPVEGDENGAIEPVAEESPDAPDLTSADSWVHTTLALNKLGRTRPNPPEMDAEGNPKEDPDAPEPSAALKSIGEDEAVSEEGEGGGAWDIRAVPVTGVPEGETPAAPIVVLRSQRFPGAYTVGLGKKYTSVYVGYGLEVSLKAYSPELPAALPTEYDYTTVENQLVKEKEDVTKDPDEGKPAEGEEAAE